MTKEDRSLGNMGELGWGCPEANLEVTGEVIPGAPQQGVGKGDGKLKGTLEGRSLLWAVGGTFSLRGSKGGTLIHSTQFAAG